MRLAAMRSHTLALCLALVPCFAFGAKDTDKPERISPAVAAKAIPSPIEKNRAIVDALRANDAEALAEAFGDESSDALAKTWEERRAAEAESEAKLAGVDAELERIWAMLLTPEGTATLAAEWQPMLAEQANAKVVAFNLGLAAMLTSLASNADFKPEETQQLSQLVLAVQRWANGMDWHDSARFDRALAALSGFARSSGLQTPRELTLLPFEEALALGDGAIATVKRVLLAYDLDVDAALASMAFEELARDGDRATVRTRFTALGVPVDFVRELRYDDRYGGRWITARESANLDLMEADMEVEAKGESATSARSAPASGTGSCKNADAKAAPADWEWSLDE